MIKKKLLKLAFALSIGLLCSCGAIDYSIKRPEIEPKKSYVLDDFKEKRKLEKDPKFMAGASKTVITPKSQVYLGGFTQPRKSEGVHDDLYARCVILDDGKNTVGFVSLDLLGLFYDDVEKIRERVSKKYGHNIIIVSTHTHSAPDTLGYFGKSLFGLLPIKSGIDQEYMGDLEKKIEDCVNDAIKHMEYAKIEFASMQAPGSISKNIRVKGYKDDELTVMKVSSLEKKTIAAIVNYASHPEVLGRRNKLISADFVGYLCDNLEKKLGGVAVFFNGALGGMVTPAVERSFKGAEKVGVELAEIAFKALRISETIYDPKISLKQKRLVLHVDNSKLMLLKRLGVLKRKEYGSGNLMTEVNVVKIGHAQFVTVPGEILPSIGFWIKDNIKEKYKFVVSLGNDELGYIMTEQEFKNNVYRYETSLSLGPETWLKIKKELMLMLD